MEDDEEDVDLFFCALIYACMFVAPVFASLVYSQEVVEMLVVVFWPVSSLAYFLIYRKIRKDYKGKQKQELFYGNYPAFATAYYYISIAILFLTLLVLSSYLNSIYWPG